MKPDLTNYEIFIIDYLDGNLTQDQVWLLFDFLQANPEIKEQFLEISGNRIIPVDYVFTGKERLRKSAPEMTEGQFELLCVAAAENVITAGQRAELDEIINADPAKAVTLATFMKTRLSAPEIVYPYKARLKRLTVFQKSVRIAVVTLGAAAAILLLFTIFTKGPVEVKDEPRYSQKTDQQNTTPEIKNTSDTVKKDTPAVKITPVPERMINTPLAITRPAIVDPVVDTAGVKNTTRQERQEIQEVTKIAFLDDVTLSSSSPVTELVAMNYNILPDEADITDEPQGFTKFVTSLFREKILKNETSARGTIKVYEIADAGIVGLNKLLGWQMSLEEKKDEQGDVKSVYFSSKLIKFNAPVKKSEPVE
ncbi:MAG: hypothetical protein U0X39_11365 [Bacteroidales bacterium]